MYNKYLTGIFLIISACCINPANTFSQDKDIPKELYTANGIPDSLKVDANSVVRYNMEEFEVKGPGKETMRYHSIVTVLNEKADREAELVLEYNRKYDNNSSIEMLVYNDKGELLKKYHKSDMEDYSATSGADLVTDERVIAVRHIIASYPATIEIKYEKDITSILNLGSWFMQDDQQSIQNSYCKVTIDNNAGFRYLNRNTNLKPDKSDNGSLSTYLWHVKNLKAVKLEERAKSWRVLTKIYFESSKFNFYSIPGDISTWQNYGKWQKALNADVCTLTQQREQEIKKMTDTIKTDKAKVRFLYNYMQQNMRYVSVQLGIGGFKPLAATFVDQKKYGDCKALSNYMSALLKAVNIPSCYAMINAGENEEPADYSFPYDPFNHIILCVPLKNDTTWLECTSSTQPFGKLGSFTENRTALIITDDGGKLVHTPKSVPEDNQFNSEVHLAIDSDGGAKAQVKVLCTGVYRDDYVDHLPKLKYDEQKEEVMRMLKIRQASVFDYKPGADNNGVKEVELNLEYDKFCDIMVGDKQFYRPHVFDLCAFTIPTEEKRKSDYYFENPVQKTCITTIDLPKGFEIETLPANQTLKFTYGNYDIKYVYDAAKNQVIATAKFILNNQVIPAAKYNELQQYLDAVAKAQNKKLVIRKKA